MTHSVTHTHIHTTSRDKRGKNASALYLLALASKCHNFVQMMAFSWRFIGPIKFEILPQRSDTRTFHISNKFVAYRKHLSLPWNTVFSMLIYGPVLFIRFFVSSFLWWHGRVPLVFAPHNLQHSQNRHSRCGRVDKLFIGYRVISSTLSARTNEKCSMSQNVANVHILTDVNDVCSMHE